MEVSERKKLLWTLGTVIAKHLPQFWGNVQFNVQDGKLVNCSTLETIKEIEYKRPVPPENVNY